MKMLFKRFKYDGKPIIGLNKLKIKMKEQIEEKIKENIYSLEEVPCCICGGNNFETLSEKDRYGLYVLVVICKVCGLIQTNPRGLQRSYINISYNILNMQNADFEEIIEKPDYHFIVNSGVYVLEPEVAGLISRNQPTDMPDLLVLAKKNGFKIQVYPVNCSWFDIGEWGEYKKAIDYMKIFNE